MVVSTDVAVVVSHEVIAELYRVVARKIQKLRALVAYECCTYTVVYTSSSVCIGLTLEGQN